MKRYGGLWERVVSWENLLLAARKAQRGKRTRPSVQAFNFAQERQLLRLQDELAGGAYRPGGFRSHRIDRPKPRLISAAPYRDRVVHHALMNVLEPILDRHLHPHSYACRKGKGTHAASDRLQTLMRRHRYALQCDVKQFFPSIDHEILKGVFRRLIKDRRVLTLMDTIVDSSNEQDGTITWFPGDDLLTPVERRRGLPIGNLTSQWFSNWMLSELDHYVTSHLRLGGYLRYCDDFVVLHEDRALLKGALDTIRCCLERYRLRLHERKAFVKPVRAGLTFVGYRTWATHRLLRKDNVRAFRRRVRWMKGAYGQGTIDFDDIKPRLRSWMAHARHAHSARLIRRLSREWKFTRGGTDRASCCAGRRVEQQCHELPDHEPQHELARQSEQQQRVPVGPALSEFARHQTRNRTVYGSRERGFESPGSIPEPVGPMTRNAGRIYAVPSGGCGRATPEVPA